jgi:hypothetical protein
MKISLRLSETSPRIVRNPNLVELHVTENQEIVLPTLSTVLETPLKLSSRGLESNQYGAMALLCHQSFQIKDVRASQGCRVYVPLGIHEDPLGSWALELTQVTDDVEEEDTLSFHRPLDDLHMIGSYLDHWLTVSELGQTNASHEMQLVQLRFVLSLVLSLLTSLLTSLS